MPVDYRHKVTVPIRDMGRDGAIAFLVDVYGVTARDLTMVAGSGKGAASPEFVGSKPMMRAVRRLHLDPQRYQAVIWDVPV